MATKPTIVFIPGMFHTPWFFNGLRNHVSRRGYDTEASSLASAGTTVAVAKEGLSGDAKHVRSLLTDLIDEGKEIVIVAHSYGGLVASNAVAGLSIQKRSAAGMKGGIILILFLAGIAIPSGHNLMGIANANPTSIPWEDAEDGFIIPNNPHHRYYADIEPLLTTKAINGLQPMSSQVLTDKSGYEPWNDGFGVGYIFTENDNTLPIDLQKTMFSRFPEGSFSTNLDSGHSPFLNMPDAVAEAIHEAIEYAVNM
ncbi:Alpha/Beta hydrolase protein [Xylaria sp. FL0064]|nr:Alpha/Beta hydrolase protein [Xylaria sp. FL0064]